MLQTTLSVPLEVKPESRSRLSALVEDFREREDKGGGPEAPNFQRLMSGLPTLHFMSLSVFLAAEYDPIFILEANFDGPPGPFWGQLDALYREDLRDMLRCCKRPLDRDGPLYDEVTKPGSTRSVAPYLEARAEQPTVFHHGNRGLGRDRILEEAALYEAIRSTLDDPEATGPSPYRGLEPARVHERLRAALAPEMPWLDTPGQVRITPAERLADKVRLGVFAFLTLLCLSLPGILLAAILPTVSYLIVILVAAALICLVIYRGRDRVSGKAVPNRFELVPFLLAHAVPTLLFFGIIVLVTAGLASLLLIPFEMIVQFLRSLVDGSEVSGFGALFATNLRIVALGMVGLVLTLPLILLWLRWLEQRDSSLEAPRFNERILRDMVRREDWVSQNHMGSIVLIRPGILRRVIIRVGHLGLGLLLRVTATDGYLGSMRTVHFAHWAFLNNGSRLLFFSNFDHSWDSYLDDFIEKAHVGLTLAWGCGVGFPPTRFLIYDGASHGRLFKNWALASRAVSRFWYSAYPNLTVDQIERNFRVAEGLRKTHLGAKEAETWIRDL